MSKKLQIFSIVTCTRCGHKENFRMPTYATKYLYECPSCKMSHKTAEDQHCIFCMIGSVKCPTTQTMTWDEEKSSGNPEEQIPP